MTVAVGGTEVTVPISNIFLPLKHKKLTLHLNLDYILKRSNITVAFATKFKDTVT